MKPAFTLIELMITMIISMILINFVFSYQLNFFQEIKYLEAKESLAMNTFKATELTARGFRDGTNYTKGLICLDTYTDSNNIKTYGGDNMNLVTTIVSNEGRRLFIDNMKLKGISSQTYSILPCKDRQYLNDGAGGPWIYAINITFATIPSFINNTNIKKPVYNTYTRLVYTK
jgi:prepilin-type N-terminal cleavage/methylation domain-containing protein